MGMDNFSRRNHSFLLPAPKTDQSYFINLAVCFIDITAKPILSQYFSSIVVLVVQSVTVFFLVKIKEQSESRTVHTSHVPEAQLIKRQQLLKILLTLDYLGLFRNTDINHSQTKNLIKVYFM